MEPIKLYSTCPSFEHTSAENYIREVATVAGWSEEAGCTGMLVYSDNGQFDPWTVAHLIVENTKTLVPLVAVQPVYSHPYTVAKQIWTLNQLYRRAIHVNWIAGGFKGDLGALGDECEHDQRYVRLVEYAVVVKRLLAGESLSCCGRFFTVKNIKLPAPTPKDCSLAMFVSGSSDAGRTAAVAIGATAIEYPGPPSEPLARPGAAKAGIRVGVIARASACDAWEVARERFPDDRRGQLKHQLAVKGSDSVWHQQLSVDQASTPDSYWLGPFQSYQSMCPYLVGDYDTVAAQLDRYLAAGRTTFILDRPVDREDLDHTMTAFTRLGAL